MARFMRWAGERRGRRSRATASCGSGRWTSSRSSGRAIWEFFGVIASRALRARCSASSVMPGAEWFPGAELNYAREPASRRARPAARSRSSTPPSCASSARSTLGRARAAGGGGRRRAARARASSAATGSSPTCRTSPRRSSAFLACASIGAIWSSAAPEFGARSVIDRFAQIEPKVLLAVDGYRYGGKDFDRREVVARDPRRAADACEHTVVLPYLPRRRSALRASRAISWAELLARGEGAGRASSRCRSSIRSGCSTPPARRACRRRSCTATAGSCSSSSRSASTSTCARATACSGSRRPAG